KRVELRGPSSPKGSARIAGGGAESRRDAATPPESGLLSSLTPTGSSKGRAPPASHHGSAAQVGPFDPRAGANGWVFAAFARSIRAFAAVITAFAAAITAFAAVIAAFAAVIAAK